MILTTMTWRVKVWYVHLWTFFPQSLQKRYSALIHLSFFYSSVRKIWRIFEAKILTGFPWFHLTCCSSMEGFQTFWRYFIWIYWKFGIYYRHYRITCTLKESLYSPRRSCYHLVWIYSSYAELWFRVSFWFHLTFFFLLFYYAYAWQRTGESGM